MPRRERTLNTFIHIAHEAAAEPSNRGGISLVSVLYSRQSWQLSFLYQHDYYIPYLRLSDKEQARDSDRCLGGDSESNSM